LQIDSEMKIPKRKRPYGLNRSPTVMLAFRRAGMAVRSLKNLAEKTEGPPMLDLAGLL